MSAEAVCRFLLDEAHKSGLCDLRRSTAAMSSADLAGMANLLCEHVRIFAVNQPEPPRNPASSGPKGPDPQNVAILSVLLHIKATMDRPQEPREFADMVQMALYRLRCVETMLDEELERQDV